MKFDYIVGNPPYQDVRGARLVDMWSPFIEEASKVGNTSCMIHPGRWLLAQSGVHAKNRNKMIQNGLNTFKYYPKSEDVFSGVSVDGGISITITKEHYNGDIHYYIEDIDKGIYKENEKIFCSNFQEEAYNKTFASIDTKLNMSTRAKLTSSGNGNSNYSFIKDENLDLLQENKENLTNPIRIWMSKIQGRGTSKFMWWYIDRDNVKIEDFWLQSKKVMVDARGHALSHGKGNGFNNIPQICDRDMMGFSCYMVFPEVERERDLLLIKSLFMTKTARFLMSITQTGLGVCGFENIPDYIELAKLLPEDELFTDEWFYKTFDFSEGLINEIETRVSPKVDKEA